MNAKEQLDQSRPQQDAELPEKSDATAGTKRGSRLDLSPTARRRLWYAAMVLCLMAIAAGVYLTYTAYLAGGFLKAVANDGSSQSLFGSDLLIGYTTEKKDDEIDVRSPVVDTSGETCSFTFKIYNYAPGDKNKVNDKEINATLTISTANGSGSDWSVDPAIGAGASLVFKAYQANDYTYTVKFKKDALKNNIAFTIKAVVEDNNSPGTNLKMLAVRVAPSAKATVTPAGVTGEWVDKDSGDTNVGKFDAYNYRVTTTGAATAVTIVWSDDVELDPHFKANHPNAQTDGNKVTFDMDPGSQVITFFRADGKKPDKWENIVTSCTGETIVTGTTTGDSIKN